MLNKVMLIGRLGQDPELKYTPDGSPFCRFSVATSEKFKDRSGVMTERTEWHGVQAWGRLAEICAQYLVKGKLVYVEGPLRREKWTDKAGIKREHVRIHILGMKMLGGKASESASHSEPVPEPTAPAAEETSVDGTPITDEDIPF